MTTGEYRSWLTLAQVPGLGPVKIAGLFNLFATLDQIINAGRPDLQQAGLLDEQIDCIINPDAKLIDNAENWLAESPDHTLITISDPNYPRQLKQIYDPPVILFAKGDLSILKNLQLAIVGSRNPTNNGYDTAYQFSRHLTNTGFTITSGLALGIDAASHLGCLDVKGKTIAVTGNGLDRVYPARHRELAHRIADNGLLLSEFLPGTKPLPGNFPRRNRIISGLTLGTLVVEAAQKSGSLITAYKALEQGREVFAIPGSIHNPLSRGCHKLIREGAKLVESAQDILEELGSLAQSQLDLKNMPDAPQPSDTVNKTHQTVLDAMSFDPISIDTLVERTGLDASSLSSILLILELENKISTEAGGYYVRNVLT